MESETCKTHGHQYHQAGTQTQTKEIVLYCVKCADVKRIPESA